MAVCARAWRRAEDMDAFWVWFYDQLERKPSDKEVETLRAILEETMEAPPGTELRQSARLLQSRIGNQAMQQLMQMKVVQQQAQEKQQAEGALEEETVVPEPEQAAPEVEMPSTKAPQTPAEVLDVEESEQLEQKMSEPEFLEDVVQQVEQNTEPTTEEKLAAALAAFVPTLQRGGGTPAWNMLTTLFGEASPRAREEVLRMITTLFPKLSQTVQSVFVKKLMQWQRHSNDELAALLWLRLSPLVKVQGSKPEGGNNGGNNGNND